MRLSADRNSEHYFVRVRGGRSPFYVTVDGARVNRVLELDTDSGWLMRYVIDDAGRVVRDGDLFQTERLTGRVEIIEGASEEITHD